MPNKLTQNPEFGLRFIDEIFRKYDMADYWCYFDAHRNKWHGMGKQKTLSYCKSADLVINISGVNPLRNWCLNIPTRVFIDTDPAFTQIRHLKDQIAMSLAKSHTHYFSFAENIGKPTCKIPDDGILWKPTRQPIYLPAWKISQVNSGAKWTTVMQWDSYKEAEFKGEVYGMKSKSFMQLIDLPSGIIGESFELALGSDSAPRQLLKDKGWVISDPYQATSTPEIFQKYISNSKGEWSIAKDGYVKSNSGWFSERTLNYLASYKPCIVQDTGFSNHLPVGEGLLTFTNLSEAIGCIRVVNENYEHHCRQARLFVEEYFSSEKVLSQLLNKL